MLVESDHLIHDLVSRSLPYSLCDRDALTTIANLVCSLKSPIEACEIGSARGGSAMVILGAMDISGGGKLKCIDDFMCMSGKSGTKLWDKSPLSEFSSNLKVPIESGRLELFTVPSRVIQPCTFYGECFDFLFIDGGHAYSDCKRDIEEFWPIMKSDSIICGHDYGGEPGVKKAVDEFFEGKHENLPGDIWYVRNSSKPVI